jgi:divalent metal cation (Fe/Co/Zn/Cd) transporter
MINGLIRAFVKNAEATQLDSVRRQYGRLGGLVGVVVNLVLAGTKLLAGWLSGSLAITVTP